MVKMGMGQKNCGRTGVFAEPFFGGLSDKSGGFGQGGIHQNPVTVAGLWQTDKRNIDHNQSFIRQIGRNFVRVIASDFVGFGVVGAGGTIKRNL
jgi:hypothetical protein